MTESDPSVTPIPPVISPQTNPTLTVDLFIGEVPLDSHRSILVFRRQHAGRTFIRWRVFHRHRKGGNWYPDTRRAFVIPLDAGDALASAIAAARRGDTCTAKPEWLAQVDAWRERRHLCLLDLNAPPAVMESERRKRMRGYGMGRSATPSERAKRRRDRQLAIMERAQRLLPKFRGGSQ